MSGDILQFPSDDLALELELDDQGLELELETAPLLDATPSTALVTTALVEVLPADFPLPALIKFIPNPALRVAAEQSAAYALTIAVEGVEGLKSADLAATALRASLKAIDEHLEEPIAIANQLHKRLTGVRSEWKATGDAALRTVGTRIYTEKSRLDNLAAEERRRQQAEADRLAREAAQREAAAAEQAKAPAPVVEELKRQAATATAPPISYAPATTLSGSSTVKTWKARFAGTPGSDEPNPDATANLSAAERLAFFHLVVNVAAQLARDLQLTLEPEYLTKCKGAPVASVEVSWKYLNDRAKSDKGTLAIPGIEAFEQGSVRAKGSRSR